MKLSPFAILPGDYFGIHCASKSQEQHSQCCLQAGQVRLSFLLLCTSKNRKEAGCILWLFSRHSLAPFSLASGFQSQIGLDFLQGSLVRLCKSVASSRAREQRTHTVTCMHSSWQAVMEMDTAHPFFPPACWVCSAQGKRQLVPPRAE